MLFRSYCHTPYRLGANQESLYLMFFVAEKLSTNLNHENMWEVLRRKGVPEKIIGLIEAHYEAFSSRVQHNGVLSDPIRIVVGVRQECILSPLLFLIVIDEILVGAINREPNRGLLWQPITMEHLNDFELVDDIALLAQRRSDMHNKLDDLANRSSAAGSTINANKTKSLNVNTVNPSRFTVAVQAVENVESFQYLGSQTTANGGTNIDIGARIKKAKAEDMDGKTVRLVDAPKSEFPTRT